MAKPSVEDELNGIQSAKNWCGELNFGRALEKAEIAYLLSFDPEYLERQDIWQKVRFTGMVDLSHPWSVGQSANRKLEADMLAIRSAATSQEKFALLNYRRLPGRLNTSETALLLGFQEHDIAPLVAAKLVVPLGKPAADSPKYFAAVEIVERATNPGWLAEATKVLARNWQRKNQRKQERRTIRLRHEL
jgi:hypothetical protein